MAASRNSKGMGTGGVSILIVFVTLCVVIFGTLALLTASSDRSLSERARIATEQYYAADAKAETILAGIVRLYGETQADGLPLSKTAELLTANFKDVTVEYDALDPSARPVVAYAVPVDELRTLSVELTLCGPGERFPYLVNCWKITVESTAREEDLNDDFSFWDGE